MNWKKILQDMTTTGTGTCAVLGAVIGFVFAILILTIGFPKALLIGVFCAIGAFIGGVKNKMDFIRKIILHFHSDGEDRYE